jgi:hypothetical protein
LQGDFDRIPTIPIEKRNELFSLCRSLNEYHPDTREYKVVNLEYKNTDKPGDQYNADQLSIKDGENRLIQHGWVNVYGKAWRRPGKDKGSISATYGHVAHGWLYVFSSNAHPFDSGRAYSPFQQMALLDYNGNFNDAAKHLAEKYRPFLKSVPAPLIIKQEPIDIIPDKKAFPIDVLPMDVANYINNFPHKKSFPYKFPADFSRSN